MAILVAVLGLAGLTVGGEPSSLLYVATTCATESGVPYALSGYQPLPVQERPYERTAATALDLADPQYDVGRDGVVRQPWDGYPDGVYHPVNMEWYALYLLESYRATRSTDHLNRAIANADALLAGLRSSTVPCGSATPSITGCTVTAPWR